MKNKTCGECRFFESKEFICCHSGDEVAAHFFACIDFEPVTEQKPTNGDKIRQMSDEELAIFLNRINCIMSGVCNEEERTLSFGAYEFWMTYLKQEAKYE